MCSLSVKGDGDNGMSFSIRVRLTVRIRTISFIAVNRLDIWQRAEANVCYCVQWKEYLRANSNREIIKRKVAEFCCPETFNKTFLSAAQ